MPSEHSEQIVIAKWLRKRRVRFIHVPNGMWRSKREGQILKAMGVQAGVPDFLIFDKPFGGLGPYVGTVLEMKKLVGGRLSSDQEEWLEILTSLVWYTGVAAGADAARDFLLDAGY